MSTTRKKINESVRMEISRPSSSSSPALVGLQQDLDGNHSIGFMPTSISDGNDLGDTRRHQFGLQRASSLANISIVSSEENSTLPLNSNQNNRYNQMSQRTRDTFLVINENQNNNGQEFFDNRDVPTSSEEDHHNNTREQTGNVNNEDINSYTTTFFGFVISSLRDLYTNRGYFALNNQQQEQRDDNNVNNSRPFLHIRRNAISNWIAIAIPFFILTFLKVFMDNCLAGVGIILMILSQKTVARRFFGKCSKKLTIVMIIGTIFRIWFCITWFNLDFMLYSIILQDKISKWPPKNISTTLFVTFVTDLFFIDIILTLKMLVSLIPYVQQHKIRSMYQWIEMTGKIYAHILPMAQWLVYFESLFLQILYISLKINFSSVILYDFWMCTKTIISPTPFPSTIPSPEDLEKDSQCGICYSNFMKPLKLECNHIFCKECISTWFDRKDTCPLCRTLVQKFKNEYKDGQTTFLHPLF
ncbi:Zinc finger, RING-type domain and Zinc finger, RING/FYVE/PHD-type domain-containing protein [Strongyloides ratti]|uniref:Zinc finger, RING-type domain and Zinc finger, RING/FYVE/PHD-type domain-containing protein n=1 Tax=Strongyloides ratti TaxID=34506 RepID=A0A090LMP1_STRRB|nr:Zinc finger, RING-type domain and Zinc finger, RING/FYVE/PHD-type domain-containing protein [Strongyloides ratti]CEF71110.1 Zinc finger, RING-type domain and Zinc finger, RING/FYVE/PHD-type domain-containing protein [Strongyloides ratti]